MVDAGSSLSVGGNGWRSSFAIDGITTNDCVMVNILVFHCAEFSPNRHRHPPLPQIKSHPFFSCINWGALDRREIPPPWSPNVRDPTDTRNIAAEFTSEPAAVTPSPSHSRLRDMTGETPPSFTAFTFTHESVLDGQTYRLSFAGECLVHTRVASRSASLVSVSFTCESLQAQLCR